VLLGARNTGKTSFLIDFLFHIKDKIPTAVVFCPTEGGNNTYKQMFPGSFIYGQVTTEHLERLIKRQKEVAQNPPPGVTDTKLLIIFDDCMSDKKAMSSPLIKWIFMNGRHYNIMIVVLVQYCMDLIPSCRQNADYVVVMQEDDQSVKIKLFQQYFGIFPTKELFLAAMTKFTHAYGVLVLNKRIRSTLACEKIFWYKATHIKADFKVGNAAYWKYHTDFYRDEADTFIDWVSLHDRELAEDQKRLEKVRTETIREQTCSTSALAPTTGSVALFTQVDLSGNVIAM
jgi:hypothetical protein